MIIENEKFIKIHPEFKLNGERYTLDKLRKQATFFISNGEPYEESVGVFLLDWLNDNKYVTVNTSGSTGTPKSIRLRKIHMVNSAIATGKHFKLKEKTKALLCLPTHFIAGKMMLVRALILGWHLDMGIPSTNPLDHIFRRYDFCAMTPLQLDNSLGRMHLLEKLIVGGGPVPPELRLRLREYETKMYETYGMTETITHIATRRLNNKKTKTDNQPFKTLQNVTVAVDDRGCLIIKAPKVSTDPVVTNDLVDIITYKKFIWKGRIDNVVNSGGVKLHPEGIEQELAAYIDTPFFVAGLPDDKLGERLVLFVEQEEPYAFAKAYFKDANLTKLQIPKEAYTVARFERTGTGKIKRGETIKAYFDALPNAGA